MDAMGFVWQVLMSIALPTTLFALGGRWLDHKLGMSPWFTIIGFFLALFLSSVLIIREAKQYQDLHRSKSSASSSVSKDE